MHSSRRSLLLGMGATAVTAAASPSFTLSYLSGQAKETGQPIRLDRNENPYGPAPLAIAAMRDSLESANRYPDSPGALQERIAQHHRVKKEQIVLGCGSSEVLRVAADAFLKPGKKLVIARPTFPLLTFYARNKGVEVVEVPLAADRSQVKLVPCYKSDYRVHQQ